jgi:hypothetical protein
MGGPPLFGALRMEHSWVRRWRRQTHNLLMGALNWSDALQVWPIRLFQWRGSVSPCSSMGRGPDHESTASRADEKTRGKLHESKTSRIPSSTKCLPFRDAVCTAGGFRRHGSDEDWCPTPIRQSIQGPRTPETDGHHMVCRCRNAVWVRFPHIRSYPAHPFALRAITGPLNLSCSRLPHSAGGPEGASNRVRDAVRPERCGLPYLT